MRELKDVRRRICQHLKASGLPRGEAARLASLTVKWVECSGITWAAKRWKAFGTYAHKCISGERPPLPQGWSIRRTRRGRRVLKDRFLCKLVGGHFDSRRSLVWIEAVSRIGSALIDTSPSQEKCFKTLTSITDEFTGKEQTLPNDVLLDFVSSLWMDEYVLKAVRGQMTPLRSTPPSDKRSPYHYFDGTCLKMRTGPRTQISVISPTWFQHSILSEELMDEYGYELSQYMTGHAGWVPEWLYEDRPQYRNLPVGRLSLLNKDGNAKIRVVASPCWDLQVCLEPLKRVLEHVVKHHPCSAVHDQQAGIDWVHQQLKAGHKCYGFDQSSFTDRFPYKLQRDLLVTMARKGLPVTGLDFILLDRTTHGWWEVPHLGLFVQYAVGQPMGTNPSFFLATLAHICVVQYAAKLAQWHGPLNEVCRIVGDDIVISDDEVAFQYERIMVEHLGVTINRDKSLMSRIATQFLGKLILNTGPVPSTKIRPINDAQTLLEKVVFYGHRALKFFKKELEQHPEVLLPAPAGGGVKPPSIPYSDWIGMLDARRTRKHREARVLDDFVGSLVNGETLHDRYNRLLQWDGANPSANQDVLQSNLEHTTPEDDLSIVLGNSSKYPDDCPKPRHADLVDLSIRQAPSMKDRITAGSQLLHPIVAVVDPREKPTRLPIMEFSEPTDRKSVGDETLLADARSGKAAVLKAINHQDLNTKEMTNHVTNASFEKPAEWDDVQHTQAEESAETEESSFGPS